MEVVTYLKRKSMKLLIDHREHALLQQFDDVATNLEVGDVHVVNDEGVPQFIFERKTIADLAASLKDGRYREQKVRLHATEVPAKRIGFLIEGRLSSQYGVPVSTLESMLLGIQYRDGFHVHLFDNGLDGTVTFLRGLMERLEKNPEKWTADDSTCSYISSLKTKVKKIANITPDVCYQLQLCQIPGISAKIAKEIVDRYPSMMDLLLTLRDAHDAVKELASVPLIGNKKAKTIISYMFPHCIS